MKGDEGGGAGRAKVRRSITLHASPPSPPSPCEYSRRGAAASTDAGPVFILQNVSSPLTISPRPT